MDMVLMVLILSGNSLTVLSIVRHPRLSSASNQIVLGLACADILVGFTMPYHTAFYLYPSLGHVRSLCLLRFVLLLMACCSSILHLIAIAIDRYLAIVYPLRHSSLVTKRLARRVIAGNWVVAATLATTLIYWNDWQESGTCEVGDVIPREFVLLVVLPLFTMLFFTMLLMYARIQRVAAQQARRLSSPHVHLASSARHWQAGRKSLQVVSLVLGCFCICWLPYVVIVTMLTLGTQTHALKVAYKLAFSLAMANSSMNPIIYAWKNKDFKLAFRHILSCGRRKPSDLDDDLTRPASTNRNNSVSTISNGGLHTRPSASSTSQLTRSSSMNF